MGAKLGLQVHYSLVAAGLEACRMALRSLLPPANEEEEAMCDERKDCGCRRGKDPKGCSEEQKRECHPEGGHPCEEEGGDRAGAQGK